MGIFGAVALVTILSDSRLIGAGQYADFKETEEVDGRQGRKLSIITRPLSGAERLQLSRELSDLVLVGVEHGPEMTALFLDELASHPRLNDMHRVLHSYLYGKVHYMIRVNISIKFD